MNDPDRLSQIDTLWSVVRRAHVEQPSRARDAQQEMIERYGNAIRQYLRGALRDDAAADEVYQEFALRFVRGDLRSADPDRGRFRNYLKTILFRLVADHHRRGKRQWALPMGAASTEPAATSPDQQMQDEQFTNAWRGELLRRSWDALAEAEKQTGKPWFTVLQLRVQNPDMRSTQLAIELSKRLDKPTTTANFRVLLHRARERFAGHLLDLARQSLADPSSENVQEELADLRLLEYCRPVLARHK
jgi:RNA polymerase sigma-70 factor (ECF subfamily)